MYIKYNCYVLQYFKGKQLRNKMSIYLLKDSEY